MEIMMLGILMFFLFMKINKCLEKNYNKVKDKKKKKKLHKYKNLIQIKICFYFFILKIHSLKSMVN